MTRWRQRTQASTAGGSWAAPLEGFRLNQRYLDLGLIAIAMIAAAAVFTSQIGADGLWQDEGATAHYATLPADKWARTLVFIEPHNAIYYVVIRIWTLAFGLSEPALRSFSILCAVATIPLVYVIGRRLGGTFTAVAAALLFVLSPFVLTYAVEARPYGLAMLLTTGATWLLLRAADRADRRAWILYAVVMALAVWTHFFVAFVVPAHLIWVLLGSQAIRRPGLFAVGAILAASVPMGIAIVLWSTERDWIATPTLISAVNRLLPVVGVRRRDLLSAALGLSYLGALVLVGGTLLRQRLAAAHAGAVGTWDAAAPSRTLVVLWAVVPVTVGLLVSLVEPVFVSRSLVVILPALLLALAAALPLLRYLWVSVVAILLVAIITFSQATLNLRSPKADFRGAFLAMASQAVDGDRVLVYPVRLIWMTAGYYVDRTAALEGVELLNARNIERNEARRLIARASAERIWLVIYDGSLDERPLGLPSVLRALNRGGYRLVSTLQVHRIQLVLYARAGGS